jgi:hypothetical protein
MLSGSLARLPAITSFNRPVTNLTKLEGMYDFDFRFANEFGRGGPPPVSVQPPHPTPSPRRRAGVVHGSAGAIGVEAGIRSGDTGCPRDSIRSPAYGELRGTNLRFVCRTTKG